jgi:flagellar hook-basal body complex protein FliE
MKLKVLFAALAVAAILPVAALADPASASDKANGARACQALRTAMTEATFKATYGTNADKSNAFGKCVSKWTQEVHQNRHAAETACKAEQADPAFATTHDGKTFAQYYGGGRSAVSALNRCIQSKQAAATAADKQDVVNAARTCKAERKSTGDVAFKAKYGTNADKSNAFGKCVAKLASA